jgi:cystathionine beta-lyase
MPEPQGTDPATLRRHFGADRPLLPLWIAEPNLALPAPVVDALRVRAESGWYGYETRPEAIGEAFWAWMSGRHDWDASGLHTIVSPSVGTSIGVLVDRFTEPGDGVILQPPVFTDFKPLVTAAGRIPIRNPLLHSGSGYRIDTEGLAELAADPANRLLILCSPHNPVGRVWSATELNTVASICAEHDVFVVADEIHADLTAARHDFVPFATAAAATGVRWAATHGPVKTFGLAGVCDTLVVTAEPDVVDRFGSRSSQFHLTRNNVFGLAAFEAAYQHGGPWLDDLLALIEHNLEILRSRLPSQIGLEHHEGTYLAWLDLRRLGVEVPQIASWLAAEAGLALSPGHWFGREGAGFVRMTIASPADVIEQAADRLAAAVASLG